MASHPITTAFEATIAQGVHAGITHSADESDLSVMACCSQEDTGRLIGREEQHVATPPSISAFDLVRGDRPPPSGLLESRWLILGILFFARTAMAFQFQSIAALGPAVVANLALDYTLLGLLAGLYLLPGIFLALPGGLLGQWLGDKRVAVLGLSLMTIGGAWVGLSETYTSAVSGRFVSGIGAVLLNVMLTKMVADWFAGREIATAMALLLSSWPIGIGLGLIALPPLAEASGVLFAFVTTALFCAVALGMMIVLYAPPGGLRPNPGSLHLRLSRPEWLLAILSGLIWSLYNVGFILVLTFGPVFLSDRGYSVSASAATVSLVSWTILVSLPLGGYLAERLNWPDGVLGGCLVASAVAVIAFSAGLHPTLLCAIIGIIIGPPAGLIMRLPAEALSPDNRAAGMGVFFTLYYLGMGVLPAIAGTAVEATHDPATALHLAAALVLLAAGLLILFRLGQRTYLRKASL